jgi:hypothetical protein
VLEENPSPGLAASVPLRRGRLTIRNPGSARLYPAHAPQAAGTSSRCSARRFAEDMRAFFAQKNGVKRDEIAARQLHALRQHYAGKLKLIDVREMFMQMRGKVERYLIRRFNYHEVTVEIRSFSGRPHLRPKNAVN